MYINYVIELNTYKNNITSYSDIESTQKYL